MEEPEKLDWDALRTVTDKVLRYKPSKRASASRSTPPKAEPAEEEKPAGPAEDEVDES